MDSQNKQRTLDAVRVFALLLVIAPAASHGAEAPEPFGGPYAQSCSVCHGDKLQGAPQGTPLVGIKLKNGDAISELVKSIADGSPQAGMPAWSATMDAVQIRQLAAYISEKRAGFNYADFKVGEPPALPQGSIDSEKHAFRVEIVAEGIDRLPYSLAPLPDGRFLLTEKTRGLRIVGTDGKLSELVRGTPKVYDDGFLMPGLKIVYGLGNLLDVVPHPDYRKNGWIYLHYTDRCRDCNEESRKSKRPVSMNKLIRGRIRDGEWVDEQVIWSTPVENYTGIPDMAAGGRVAFDGKGHVFISIGIKASEFAGIQDLALPYGKIHRLNDDGSIPTDNPFVKVPGALPSIWTYGHRSPQGLEFNRKTRQLWETEMGQRGGDEVNLLSPGKNYGWPLVSKGITYEGTPVAYGKQLGIEVDLSKIEQPKVDLTPSPAVSSFVFYDGAAFPKWRQNMLVGTLKATELYRMEIKGDQVVHRELLLTGLGRIRDIAVGPDGLVYLLLEHASSGRIIRLVPAKSTHS